MQRTGHDVQSSLVAPKGFIDSMLHLRGLPATAMNNLRLARQIASRRTEIAERVQATAEEPLPGVGVALVILGHQLCRELWARPRSALHQVYLGTEPGFNPADGRG